MRYFVNKYKKKSGFAIIYNKIFANYRKFAKWFQTLTNVPFQGEIQKKSGFATMDTQIIANFSEIRKIVLKVTK